MAETMKKIREDDIPTYWNAFAGGDETAFTALYYHYYNDLYAYGCSLGMKSYTEDGIQEIFLKLYTRKGLLRDASRLKAFLFISLKNYLTDRLRKEGKLASLSETGFDFRFHYTIDESLFQEEERQRLKMRIEAMLACLTSRQREAVYLYFLHELDVEEMANVLGMNVQSVRNLLSRALACIRRTENGLKLLVLLFYFSTEN